VLATVAGPLALCRMDMSRIVVLTLGTARTTNTLSAGSSTMSVAHFSRNLPVAVVSYTIATRLLNGMARLEAMRPYMGLLLGLLARTGCKIAAAAGPNCCSCTAQQ